MAGYLSFLQIFCPLINLSLGLFFADISLSMNLQRFGMERVAKVESLQEIITEMSETGDNSTRLRKNSRRNGIGHEHARRCFLTLLPKLQSNCIPGKEPVKKRLSLLLTGVLVALRCLVQRLQELFPAHLSRSTTEHLIEKNVHSLIICDAIFVTVWHEHHLPSFSNLTSPKAPFNEAVPSSYT